jgi:hypothetical protein
MPSLISLPPNAAVHQDDAVSGIKAPKLPSRTEPAPTTDTKSEPSKPPEFTIKANSVALSFAYDIVTQALNVVMTDKHSGEVVRKISYTHLPTGVHQSDKLHGLLLDELA